MHFLATANRLRRVVMDPNIGPNDTRGEFRATRATGEPYCGQVGWRSTSRKVSAIPNNGQSKVKDDASGQYGMEHPLHANLNDASIVSYSKEKTSKGTDRMSDAPLFC